MKRVRDFAVFIPVLLLAVFFGWWAAVLVDGAKPSSTIRCCLHRPGAFGRSTCGEGSGVPALLSVRGGASSSSSDDEYDDEYDEYDEEEEEEVASSEYDEDESEDESESEEEEEEEEEEGGTHLSSTGVGGGNGSEDWDLVDQVLLATKRILVLAGRFTISAVLALQRAAEAAVEDGDEGEGLAGKVGRMFEAALNPPLDEVEGDELAASVRGKGGGDLEDSVRGKGGADLERSVRRKSRSSRSKAAPAEDMGKFLSESYAVPSGDDSAPITGGSLLDSLSLARSRARLLVAYIPATKSSKHHSGKNKYDRLAISSLLSADVKATAERRARKKEEYGSFDLWCGEVGSSEANSAIKMLKPKKVSGGSPYLMVCYGALGVDSSGRPRVIPKLLAQHHCNPPPSPSSLSSWLNALRKRHAKQYASMHHALREERYFRERAEGYRSSKREDREREEKERREEEERERREREERERLMRMEERRIELRENLPEEPPMGSEGTVTVALRFADGRTGRRRFSASTATTDTLLDWVDAMFGMEREKVELSTMNGSKRFRYEGEGGGETLEEAGLGKMVGLRVTELKEEEEEDGSSDDDGEEEGDGDDDSSDGMDGLT